MKKFTPQSQLNLSDSVRVDTPHRLVFVNDAFRVDDPTLAQLLTADPDHAGAHAVPTKGKVLVVCDQGLILAQPDLQQRVMQYLQAQKTFLPPVAGFRAMPGGEQVKNDLSLLESLLGEIDRLGICRHSTILVIGGGALLDMVGFAASVAHRGIRLVRMPTTTMGQADSGMGVKNGVNMFGQKNFIGTFTIPQAVVCDTALLTSLDANAWQAGFAEAVKVFGLKDAKLFTQLQRDAEAIRQRNMARAIPVIEQSAQLHYRHILDHGDPFERTNVRPLDFGHWSAHQLEPMTNFELGHGQAVAIGLALDCLYANRIGIMPTADMQAVLDTLVDLGLPISHPALDRTDELLAGLEAFRRHLGGELTITLLAGISKPIDVHEVDMNIMATSMRELLAMDHSASVGAKL